MFDRKKHWENIYQTKQLNEVSWYQPKPETSLAFLDKFGFPITSKIIDIGGGDSFFVDHLLDLGYEDITVLDISETAIERAKARLGEKAEKVKWIITDISDFQSSEKYDFWHDRAAFHFLTDHNEIESYLKLASQSIHERGILAIGTFSEQGPKKCSGIEIKQYSEDSMTELFRKYFEKISCFSHNHTTPFDTIQNFLFCTYKKIKSN